MNRADPSRIPPALWTSLAALQDAAYRDGAASPYSAAALRSLASASGGALLVDDLAAPAAFALGRASADEGELLALAVCPHRRRRGHGAAALAAVEAALVDLGARRLFLEVAADNAAALGLYRRAGWRDAGRRRGYYAPRRPGGLPADALVLAKSP